MAGAALKKKFENDFVMVASSATVTTLSAKELTDPVESSEPKLISKYLDAACFYPFVALSLRKASPFEKDLVVLAYHLID